MKVRVYLFAALAVAAVLSGCGKKVDTNKSIEQINAEVEKMSVGQIEAEAKGYIKEILRTRAEFEKVKNKLQNLPSDQLFSEKSRSLQKEMSDLTRRVSDLTDRYQIYADKHEDLGGEAAKIQVR